MCIKKFSDRTYRIGSKIRQKEGAGGGGGGQLSFPIFLIIKMTFNLNKFWYGVRWYKGKFVKKVQDNTTKDNFTVTSLNISENDGTIKILKILKS